MDGITYKQNQASNSSNITNSIITLKEPSNDDAGIAIRCIRELFNKIQDQYNELEELGNGQENTVNYTVKCSFVQIYQEQVLDLLNVNSSSGLKVRWDTKQDFYVENLFINTCNTAAETIKFYLSGLKKRIIATHKLNAVSSRSHCIFTLYVSKNDSNYTSEPIVSKLCLVDLAGSERANMTGATGMILKQSIAINKSLFVLRKVIKSLSKAPPPQPNQPKSNNKQANKPKFNIPYRDSILTKLLKNSLGGNCILLMFACLCPQDKYCEENFSTLNYAGLTKKISNSVVINEDPKILLIKQLREEIRVLKLMLARAKQNVNLDTEGLQLISIDNSKLNNNAVTDINSDFHNTNQDSGKKAQQLMKILSSANLVNNNHNDSTNSSDIPILTTSDHKLLAEKFLESVAIIKDLIADNNQLRTVVANSNDNTNKQAQLNHLMKENEKLQEKITFLEQTIVEANKNKNHVISINSNEIVSPVTVNSNEIDNNTTIESDISIDNEIKVENLDPVMIKNNDIAHFHANKQNNNNHNNISNSVNPVMLAELDELRTENERLKSLIISSEFDLEQTKKQLKQLKHEKTLLSNSGSNLSNNSPRKQNKQKRDKILHLEEFNTYFTLLGNNNGSNKKKDLGDIYKANTASNETKTRRISTKTATRNIDNNHDTELDDNFDLVGSFDFNWANNNEDNYDNPLQLNGMNNNKQQQRNVDLNSLTTFNTSPDPLDHPFDINIEYKAANQNNGNNTKKRGSQPSAFRKSNKLNQNAKFNVVSSLNNNNSNNNEDKSHSSRLVNMIKNNNKEADNWAGLSRGEQWEKLREKAFQEALAAKSTVVPGNNYNNMINSSSSNNNNNNNNNNIMYIGSSNHNNNGTEFVKYAPTNRSISTADSYSYPLNPPSLNSKPNNYNILPSLNPTAPFNPSTVSLPSKLRLLNHTNIGSSSSDTPQVLTGLADLNRSFTNTISSNFGTKSNRINLTFNRPHSTASTNNNNNNNNNNAAVVDTQTLIASLQNSTENSIPSTANSTSTARNVIILKPRPPTGPNPHSASTSLNSNSISITNSNNNNRMNSASNMSNNNNNNMFDMQRPISTSSSINSSITANSSNNHLNSSSVNNNNSVGLSLSSIESLFRQRIHSANQSNRVNNR